MDRRDFLKTVAITGAALTIQRSEAMEVLTQTINKANGSNPDLVAVMGGEPEEMFRRAISELACSARALADSSFRFLASSNAASAQND